MAGVCARLEREGFGRELGAAAFVYTAVTAFVTWPMLPLAAEHIVAPGAAEPADSSHVMWILAWGAHALLSQPWQLFDGNILYPSRGMLAESEHLLGHMPLFAPIWWLSGNPVLALNALLLVSYVMSCVFMHAMIYRWTGSRSAAYVSGLAYGFAPWRVLGLRTPHYTLGQYLPLILLGIDGATGTGLLKFAWLAAAALAVQVLASYHLGYAAYFLAGAHILSDLIWRGVGGRGRAWLTIACACLTPLLVIVPLSLPYLRSEAAGSLSGREYESLRELAHVQGIPSLVAAQYVGFGTLALSLAALPLLAVGRPPVGDRVRITTLFLAMAGGFMLARGPVTHLGGWIAPYDWLSAAVPGFRGVRVPWRLASLASFGASGLAGFAIARVTSLIRRFRGGGSLGVVWTAGAIFAVLLPALGAQLSRWGLQTGARVPPVYRWLAKNGDRGPLLEMPFRAGLPGLLPAVHELYLSTYHWLPILNGSVRYPPPSYDFVTSQATMLPDASALRALANCAHLRWIVIHQATPDQERAWFDLPGLRFIGSFPTEEHHLELDLLYEVVLPPDPQACTPAPWATPRRVVGAAWTSRR